VAIVRLAGMFCSASIPFNRGGREQMQHRMQHEERGKQNLQDPQSNVHCMIAFSASHTYCI
jgi:hypothetical protein